MASSATVTAYSGPGKLATAMVLTQVTEIEIDTVAEILRIKSQGVDQFYALTGSNTFTFTVTAGVYSFTIA